MGKCPRCEEIVTDGAKICRKCGGIVEEVDASMDAVTPEPEVIITAEAVTDIPWEPYDTPRTNQFSWLEKEELEAGRDDPDEFGKESSRLPWLCPSCNSSVEAQFEVCWSCGTSRDGTPDPEFSTEELTPVTAPEQMQWIAMPQEEADLAQEIRGAIAPAASTCARCGSNKIIPRVRIVDQGERSDGKLQAVVHANPDAWIFKESLYGVLTADICADCGHVELWADNARELYYQWRRSR